MRFVKRMLAAVTASATALSTLAASGIMNTFAAGKANNDIAVNVNLSVLNSDVLGLDLYAKLGENIADPVLIYQNIDSGENETVTAFTYSEKQGSYKAFIPISAEKMADTYVCRIESEGKVIQDNIKYSVADYAQKTEKALSGETGRFIYSMLDYGKAAQNYFEYNPVDEDEFSEPTDDLSKSGIVSKRYIDETKLKDNGLVYETSTLLVDERLGMREYFTLADDTYTLPEDVTVDGKSAEFGSKKYKGKTYYYLDINNVAFDDFDRKYAITIGSETVAEFTVNDYILRADSDAKTPELVELVGRLYDFGQELAEYREKNNNNDVYYMVSFEAGNGVESTEDNQVYLPDTGIFKAGRDIYTLPTPYQKNATFLGWYYDKEMTRMVEKGDVIEGNMVLYANMSSDNIDILDESGGNYVAEVDIDRKDFALLVDADNEEDIRTNLTIENIYSPDIKLLYSVENIGGRTYAVIPDEGWKENGTYIARLPERHEEVQFIYFDEVQNHSVDNYVISISGENHYDLKLNKDMIFIKREEITSLTGDAFTNAEDKLSESGNNLLLGSEPETEVDSQQIVVQDFEDGTFSYDGELKIGDIVSIYEGLKPNERTTPDERTAPVSYVRITETEGDVYGYTAAEFEEIIYIPKFYPINKKDDLIPNDGNRLTLNSEAVQYSEEMKELFGLEDDDVPEVGDWIVFCDIEKMMNQTKKGMVNVTDLEYAVITREGLDLSQSEIDIAYEPSTMEEYENNLRYQYSEAVELKVPESGVDVVEEQLKKQAEDSGFIEDAVDTMAVMIESSDEFNEMAESGETGEISLDFGTLEKDAVKIGDSKSSWKFEKKKLDVKPNIKYGKNLEHFKGKNGIMATLTITFVGEFVNEDVPDSKILVTANTSFTQEIMIDYNFDFNVELEWFKVWGVKIFPIGIEYAKAYLNFNFGTFTDFSAAATVRTVNDSEELDLTNMTKEDAMKFAKNFIKEAAEKSKDDEYWDSLDEDSKKDSGDKKDDSKKKDDGGDDEEVEDVIEDKVVDMESLSKRYQKMMQDSDGEGWVSICNYPIADIAIGSFYGIVNVHAPLYFNVDACLYVGAGMTFQFAYAKGWSICVDLKRASADVTPVEIEKAHMSFDAYVMGTLGIKIGFTFCPRVNIISDKLFYAGFNLYAGLKYQLWGYFYYHAEWTQGEPIKQDFCGAIYMELAICADIRFTVQAFDSNKVKAVAPIWSDEFKIWDLGEEDSPYEFVPMEDEDLDFEIVKTRFMTLPDSIYDMNRIGMKTGEIKTVGVMTEADKIKDSSKRSKYLDEQFSKYYDVALSNPTFSYNYDTNTITVSASASDLANQDCTMVITYKNNMATSNRFKRVLQLHWIPYDSAATYFKGKNVHETCIRANAGDKVKWPDDPVRLGYIFDGWFDEQGNRLDTSDTTYPKIENDVIYTAKWSPAPNKIAKINVYIQRMPIGSEYDPFAYAATDSTRPERKKTYILAEDIKGSRDYYNRNVYYNPNEDFSGCGSLTDVEYDSNGKRLYTEDELSLDEIVALFNIPEGFSVNTTFSTPSAEVLPDGSGTVDIYLERNIYTLVMNNSVQGSGEAFDIPIVYGTHLPEFIPDLTSIKREFVRWTTVFDDSNRYMPAHNMALSARLNTMSSRVTIKYIAPLYEDEEFIEWPGSEARYKLVFETGTDNKLSLSDVLARVPSYDLVKDENGGYHIENGVFVLFDGTCVPCTFEFNDTSKLDGENIIVDEDIELTVNCINEKLDYSSFNIKYLYENENGDFEEMNFDDVLAYNVGVKAVFRYGEDVTADAVNAYSSEEGRQILENIGYQLDRIEFDGTETDEEILCTAGENYRNTDINIYFRKLGTVRISFQYPDQTITRTFDSGNYINTPTLQDLNKVPEGVFKGWTWNEVKNSKGEVLIEAQTEPTEDLSKIQNAIGLLIENRVRKIKITSVWE